MVALVTAISVVGLKVVAVDMVIVGEGLKSMEDVTIIIEGMKDAEDLGSGEVVVGMEWMMVLEVVTDSHHPKMHLQSGHASNCNHVPRRPRIRRVAKVAVPYLEVLALWTRPQRSRRSRRD
jgi:hypothetical protein